MNAANLTHLPLQVGGVVLASAGRGALWLITRYMKAPLTHTAIAALVGSTALAGSNALFMQTHAHPAPLWAPASHSAIDPSVKLVVPRTRPASFSKPAPAPVVEIKAPAAPAPALSEAGPIGNKDVIEMQRKLERLNFYTGKIDGLYGRRTAEAIRKFETATGRTPRGELSRDVLNAIIAAPLSLPERQVTTPAATPAPEPAAEVTPRIEATPEPATVTPAAASPASPDRVDPATLAQRAPLATPQPLQLETGSIAEANADTRPTLLGRPLPTTADEALDMAADTAGEAIDSIINNVQNLTGRSEAVGYAAPTPATGTAGTTANPTSRTALTELQQVSPQSVAVVPAEPTAPAQTELATASVQQSEPMPTQLEPAAPARQQTAALTTAVETPQPATVQTAPAQQASSTDPALVTKVQRGLASLGFLHGPADGVAGEATAKAIRNFETYFNFEVTGRVTPGLLDLLIDYGASI